MITTLLQVIIILSILATSVLSGVLGMAGGMILMAILVSTVSVAMAMVLHGVVQATSNGSRAYFLRAHIQWQVLPAYLIGAASALGLFTWLLLIPNPAVILISIGLFPWLARALPKNLQLDIEQPFQTFACGVVVTAAQLYAGASGPLLDVFYLNTRFDRYQVIATKAITQALGHLTKLAYYGVIVGTTEFAHWWFYSVAMLTAVLGTRIGTRLLDHISDSQFTKASGTVILLLATVCLLKGIFELLVS